MATTTKQRILIVGAGFAGATIARELADSGRYQIQLIDRRDHIGGNAYDPVDDGLNLRIHRYGPHIFHTNDQGIFEYLSRFTEWLPYRHRVEARVDHVGYVPFPINRVTINKVCRQQLQDEEDTIAYLNNIRCHHKHPANAQEVAESIYGTELTELFFSRYTRKMWGIELSTLPASVLQRLPVRYDSNSSYFNDQFQAMPKHGYIGLFENLLDHPSINLSLNCAYEKSMDANYLHVFNSMPIDVYFDQRFGPLPYRSIKFEHTSLEMHEQPTPTINFTDNSEYTRQTDWRLYPGCDLGARSVLLTKEIPCNYEDNNYERYYPVKTVDGEPQALYRRYKNEAEKLPNMTFIGRCGQYIYYDMHQVVANSLKIARNFLRQS